MFLPFFFSSLVLPFLIIPFLLVYCTKKQPPRPQPPRPAPPSTTSKAVVTRTGQPSSSSTAGSTPFSRVSLCASSLHQSSVPQPSIDQSCRGDTRASDVSAREMRSEVSCRTPELEYEIPVEEAVVMGQAEDHRWLAGPLIPEDWESEDTVSGVDVVLCPGHRIYMSDAMPQDKIKRRREVEKRVEKVGYEKMGADVPGDVDTQPSTKIVFNAPYDDKHTYHIKVTNSSARRIGWAFKTTNMKRLGVDPAAGVLDPKESTTVALTCDAFAYGQEDTNNDRVSVIWTNTPDGAAKQFSREWIQDDGMIRRKNLSIEYNP